MESSWYGRLDEGSNPSGSTFASPKQRPAPAGRCEGELVPLKPTAETNGASPRPEPSFPPCLLPQLGYGGRSPLHKMDFPYKVYILRCADGHLYVGCTGNLPERLARHGRGEVHYPSTRLPVECIAAFGFPDKYKAFNFEKYLKSGSGTAFMSRHLL